MPLEIPEELLEARRRLDPAPPLMPAIHGSCAEILPFRARDVVGMPRSSAIEELLRRAASGLLSPLEFAYSAMAIASSFRVHPRVALAGVEERGGTLIVRASGRSPRLGRRTLLRFLRSMNALARALGLDAPADPGAADELSRRLLLACGSIDRPALDRLVRGMRFVLDEEPRDGRGIAAFLCEAVRPRRGPLIRISLPGSAFSASCIDMGIEGAVAFSSELPKALNYLVGSGDVVELTASDYTVRRRALFMRDLPGPSFGPGRSGSLGAIALDCGDPALRVVSDSLSLVRLIPGIHGANPSVGSHVLFPEVEDDYVRLDARVCPVCGTITHSVRCPSCGALTEPTRVCPSCRAATKSEICERCGTPTVRAWGFRVSFPREISRFRGAEGVAGEREFPGGAHEDLLKGVLRARYGLRVQCDGTTRAAAVLLGSRGLDACSVVLPFKAARTLFEVSRFVDDVAKRIFSREPPYRLSSYRELEGMEVIVLPRGGTVGRVARISGFLDAPIGFSGAALPHGAVSLILPLDLALSASQELADARAERCGWGYPASIVDCSAPGGAGEFKLPGSIVFVESGVAPGAAPRQELERALERNVSLLSSLGAGGSREVCGELRAAVDDLASLYASPEVECESCGRRFRRPTLSGSCPYCGGRLRPLMGEPDLEALRSLAESIEALCGPSASMTLDRLVSRERQARLTDFAR